MKIIYNKFLIISTIALLFGGFYLYFSNDLKNEGIIPVAFGSSLATTNGEQASPISALAETDISSDISFLTTLVSLKYIKIDTDFFNDKYFMALKNNAVTIQPVKAGRDNPFDPIGVTRGTGSTGSQGVITDQPSQITTNSAVLNGTVKIVNESAETYFIYATNPEILNPITISATQSLVGTFIKNISGLSSKTTYYFKACAKINNATLCGEGVPFTTN